mgnify:CR=1 FL=1
MSYSSEALARYWERKKCEFFGLPVPEWAKLKRQGPRADLTPEEREQRKRDYNHRYYLAHRGANVKKPHAGRTHPAPCTPEERKRKQRERAIAWQKSHSEWSRKRRLARRSASSASAGK